MNPKVQITQELPRSGDRNEYRLPPLILHPFSTHEDQSALLESSRASLALQGIGPSDSTPIEELDRQLLRGRYAELQMLFYIGKDICRWAEQCAEVVQAESQFAGQRLQRETFVVLLVEFAPQNVKQKLEGWGVLDFSSLFRRAFGLHAVLSELPKADMFSRDFLRRYHRYFDHCYEQRLRDFVFKRPEKGQFAFDLYASGEYTSMLEQSWAEADTRQR